MVGNPTEVKPTHFDRIQSLITDYYSPFTVPMLPSSYNPTQLDHFIGPARQAAHLIERLIQAAAKDQDALRLILTGAPGIGKSKLANFFTAKLGCSKWSSHKLNGTQVSIDQVEEIALSLAYRDLFGNYRVIQIEELDKMPPVARSRMLTFCDDMPTGTALVATTNLSAEEMRKAHPAMQRRYTWIELEAPTADEIFTLLRTHWPEVPEVQARHIAVMACGCVGLALQEADAWYAAAFAHRCLNREKHLLVSRSAFPGRADSCLPAPPQTRTSRFPAYGSSSHGLTP